VGEELERRGRSWSKPPGSEKILEVIKEKQLKDYRKR
jgi:hypothetical protein